MSDPRNTACLAGRRIDAANTTTERFPAKNETMVRNELKHVLISNHVQHLVSSAACGADIIAIEIAGELGIKRTIVLPFAPAVFRRMSVADRSGDWGSRYDRILMQLKPTDDVVQLDYSEDDSEAFKQVNDTIIRRTVADKVSRKLAIIVWDGRKSNGEEDITAHVLDSAKREGLEIKEVTTIAP